MPTRIALIHASGEGQTQKIAEYMAREFTDRQVDVEVYEGKNLPDNFEVSSYDGVIIGASVHAGKYPRYIRKFVQHHRDVLQEVPSAFFSVSLSESDEREEIRQEVADLIQDFLDDLNWQPVLVASFAGAVPFSRYGFIRKMIMSAIMRRRLGEVDTNRDYEYTDWSSVDEFVELFGARIDAWSRSEEQRPPAPAQ